MSERRTSIDLKELLEDPSRIADLDGTQIPALLTQLGVLQASMAARLVAAAQDRAKDSGEDPLLSVDEAAKRLGVSADWLYRRTNKLPFVVRVGRHVRFSAGGIERFIRNRMGPK